MATLDDIDKDVAEFIQALTARIEVLEVASPGADVVYIPPDTIVQTFPDGSVITYNKAP